jgi:hypothetical protein
MPEESFSVIMLFPNAAFSEFFIGIATRLTSNKKHNQIITIPFHELTERKNPVFKEFNIFINDWTIMKYN